MWDKTFPSLNFHKSPRSWLYVKAFRKGSLFSQGLPNGTVLKNLYKIPSFCWITVKFEVGLGKTSGCSPIVFSSPQLYAKVTFKAHIWKGKLSGHKNLFQCVQAHITLWQTALTQILTVVRENSIVLFQKRPRPCLCSKWFKNSFQFTLVMFFF